MWKRRWQPPDGALNRTRLAAAGIGAVAVLAELGQLAGDSSRYTQVAAGCIVGLAAVTLLTYVRGHASWWHVPVVPVLIGVAAGGVQSPTAAASLAVGSTVALCLYGSSLMWSLRVLGALLAVPVGLTLSPTEQTGQWGSSMITTIEPQLILMFVLTRGVYVSLVGLQRAARREAVLARAGHAMIGATDIERVREVARQAVQELLVLSPGAAVLVLRRDTHGFSVGHQAGLPHELRGRVPAGPGGEPDGLTELLPRFGPWHLDSLGVEPAVAEVYIAVGGRVPPEVVNGFRSLSHQVMLAEKSCQAYAELDHLAYHDHLTELPTRAKFFRALSDALTATPAGTVALLNVDLDEFKQVNDQFGHSAGDELLLAVAERLAELAQGRGLAGRFGGDEFALLLTGLSTAEQAEEIARLLTTSLAAPVRLATTTVTIGASVGIAVAEPGITVAELIRRADVAMYAAKAAGKNRVEMFRDLPSELPALSHEPA